MKGILKAKPVDQGLKTKPTDVNGVISNEHARNFCIEILLLIKELIKCDTYI